jgi:hypothetical protein
VVVPPEKPPGSVRPQPVLLAPIQRPCSRYASGANVALSCDVLGASKKQWNRITSRDLTKTTRLSILGAVVSAGRRGLPGTSCGLASLRPTNPHRGPVWGATARVGGGLPAVVADPAGPRAGQAGLSIVGILTPIEHCATITSDRRSGTMSDQLVRFVAAKSGWSKGVATLISSRVEEIHKTSREPNGRTREEGSDGRGNPRRGSRTNSGAAFLSSR